MAGAPVGEAVDQPRVAVEVEDDGLAGGEQGVVGGVGQPVGVLGGGLQPHEVDDVDHPHLQVGQVAAQQVGGGQGLQGRHVAGAGQHHVGFASLVGAGPRQDAEAPGAVRHRVLHRHQVEHRLLARDHDVDVVPRAQAVVGHRQQRVGVRRQVHPHHGGLLVDHHVQEAGVLVAEPVVVLTPHVRAQQVVERGDRAPPRDVPAGLQPLGVLVEHRVDDVDERLVGVEQPVAPGEQVALQPALAQVLAEHLHHPAVGGEVLVGRQPLGHPRPVGDLEHRRQPVGVGLVGSEQPEVDRVGGDDVTQEPAEHPGRLGGGGGRRLDLGRVVAEVGQHQRLEQLAAVGVRVGAHPARPLWHQGVDLPGRGAVPVEELLGPVGAHPLLKGHQMVGVVAHPGQRHLVGAPGALHRVPVDLLGPGPPLGRTEDDHGPAVVGPGLDLGDLVEHRVQGLGHQPVGPRRVVTGDHVRAVAVPLHELEQLRLGDPRQHRRVGDLVPVEVQDGQDRAVPGRVEKLVGVPAGGQGGGLRLAVPDDAGDHQAGVVERGAVGVGQ